MTTACNRLIEASAGTGKTQALAERLIDLLRANVRPQEIVALTFSRAAAGEIFERFVTLLAASAERNPRDAALLREVIATQHLSQIGTLDSFLMRIVRSFPLELGLSGRIGMMDEYEAAAERARVSFGILRRTDAHVKRLFGEAFALVTNRENVRSYIAAYRAFVSAWHERYLAMEDPAAWGDERRMEIGDWGSRIGDPRSEIGERKAAADALEGLVDSKAWAEFVRWVRDFRGTFPEKGFAKKFVEMGPALFAGDVVEVSYSRKEHVFAGREAAAIRRAFAALYGMVLRQKIETARGIHKLVESFETDYAKKVRKLGKLVFADVPRLILDLDDGARSALEYRMDAKIRAWALDEFQDTSREQWKALKGLVEEAKQSDGEKSVFVVGDRKQAIYGWRNGDVRIFAAERDSGAYEVKPLNRSWRYGQPIVDAVNAVFVDGRLKDEFPGWVSPRHETAKPDLGGFVQSVESAGPKMEDFVEPVYNALQAIEPVRRGISSAVLVRTNAFGRFLTTQLKARGLDNVVWEGESDVLDTPALLPFIDTLALAEHPGDRQAYEHFRRSRLARAKYGETVPDAAALSGEYALAYTTKGMVRTFRELRAALPERPDEAWSAFTESRFTDLLRAAAEFELTLEAGVRLGDFVSYLKARTKRTVAEPGKIRILTIHRSKGLGFDHVVLPLYEHDALDAEPDGPLLGEDWILPDPGVHVTRVVPSLAAAAESRKERGVLENLCTYYVAMTRAKHAMTLVLHPALKTSSARRFSQFVREALPEPIGRPDWYRVMDDQGEGRQPSSVSEGEFPPIARSPRQSVRRRLPSLSFHTGESAGNLFAAFRPRKAAAERGVTAHAAFEKVEWLAPESAKTSFERALTKPAGLTALWRERPFEVFADGEWTSGRFDRVVFADGRATIYDFKTNRPVRGESAAAFAERMTSAYAGQMLSYRKALAALTGLPFGKIDLVLLLTETSEALPLEMA